MQLYLVQHGQAKTKEEDPERPLTDQGVDDASGVARRAVDDLGVRPARLLHSGKTRARQTADIWGGLLGAAVEEVDALAPNDDPTTWQAQVAAEADDLLLVGHLPHLARLAGLLHAGGPVQAGRVGRSRADRWRLGRLRGTAAVSPRDRQSREVRPHADGPS